MKKTKQLDNRPEHFCVKSYTRAEDMTDIIKSYDKISIPTRDNIMFLAKLYRKPPILSQRRTTEHISPKEVIRPTNVVVIGDLHGNISALWGNLNASELIDENNNWIGGDTHVVFVGDILADRHQDGIQILHHIDKLQKQAALTNGEITVLSGNHDNYAISKLMGIPCEIDNFEVYNVFDYIEQANGILEFVHFLPKKTIEAINSLLQSKNSKKFELIDMLMDGKLITNKLLETNIGKIILDQIKNFRLVVQVDDILITHTNLSDTMIRTLHEYGEDYINNVYINGKIAMLFDNKDESELHEHFLLFQHIFLNTNNRFYAADYALRSLKSLGINCIINGHTNTQTHFIQKDDLSIISVDFDSYKINTVDNKKSFIKINKKFEIIGPDNKIMNNTFIIQDIDKTDSIQINIGDTVYIYSNLLNLNIPWVIIRKDGSGNFELGRNQYINSDNTTSIQGLTIVISESELYKVHKENSSGTLSIDSLW